jgi:hypothetical protein
MEHLRLTFKNSGFFWDDQENSKNINNEYAQAGYFQ